MTIMKGMYILSENPLVIACREDWAYLVAAAVEQNRKIKHCEVFGFIFWCALGKRRMLNEWIRKFKNATSRTTIHTLFSYQKEVDAYRRVGLNQSIGNTSVWLNDRLFGVSWTPVEERPYDAIYIAAMEDYKRPWLAKDVERLLVVSRTWARHDSGNIKNYGLDHATLNDREVERSRVRDLCNSAAAGLMLSKVEGNCLAATEYFLCGLPLVTTHSLGGREAYYTPVNHLLVADEAAAVKAAVLKLKEQLTLELSTKIRNDALATLTELRANFIRFANEQLGFQCLPDDYFAAQRGAEINCYVPKAKFFDLMASYDGERFHLREVLTPGYLH